MTVQHLLIEASCLSDTNGSTWQSNQFPQITEVASCVQVLGKNLSYQTASVHPAVMGTWWNEKMENYEMALAAENALNSPQRR